MCLHFAEPDLEECKARCSPGQEKGFWLFHRVKQQRPQAEPTLLHPPAPCTYKHFSRKEEPDMTFLTLFSFLLCTLLNQLLRNARPGAHQVKADSPLLHLLEEKGFWLFHHVKQQRAHPAEGTHLPPEPTNVSLGRRSQTWHF